MYINSELCQVAHFDESIIYKFQKLKGISMLMGFSLMKEEKVPYKCKIKSPTIKHWHGIPTIFKSVSSY